jgi:hypothetical protein
MTGLWQFRQFYVNRCRFLRRNIDFGAPFRRYLIFIALHLFAGGRERGFKRAGTYFSSMGQEVFTIAGKRKEEN